MQMKLDILKSSAFSIESVCIVTMTVYVALHIPPRLTWDHSKNDPWKWYNLLITFVPLLFGAIVLAHGSGQIHFIESAVLVGTCILLMTLQLP